MAFKMKNPMGNIANTKSHGTNANFIKSGVTNADGSAGAPFIGGLVKGALGVGKKLLGGVGKKLMDGIGGKLMGGLSQAGKNMAGKMVGKMGGAAGQAAQAAQEIDPFADDESEPKRYGPSKEQKEAAAKDTRSAKDIMRAKKAFADKYFKK